MMTMRRGTVLVALCCAGLGACGPVPVADAERSCLRDAQLARRPQTEIGLGVTTDGHSVSPHGRFEIAIGSDYIMGRDPSDVYNSCVMRRSGRAPTRALYDQPGWKG